MSVNRTGCVTCFLVYTGELKNVLIPARECLNSRNEELPGKVKASWKKKTKQNTFSSSTSFYIDYYQMLWSRYWLPISDDPDYGTSSQVRWSRFRCRSSHLKWSNEKSLSQMYSASSGLVNSRCCRFGKQNYPCPSIHALFSKLSRNSYLTFSLF